MKQVFAGRRRKFWKQISSYIPYVLNDHFVLALLFLLGFASLQYRSLMLSEAVPALWIFLGILGISLLLLFSGRIASYIEAADRHYLLVEEETLVQEVREASRRASLVWGSVFVLGQLLLVPLLLKIFWPIWAVVLWILFFLGVKVGYHNWQASRLLQGQGLDWTATISSERGRKQAVLAFFSNFTHVKGLISSVKPRKILVTWLKKWTGLDQSGWGFLFLRAFVRQGDFLVISLRLVLLGVLALVFVSPSWLAVGLALLFHYLLLFQLLALYHSYDYHPLTSLFPLDHSQKAGAFRQLVSLVLNVLLGINSLVFLLVQRDWTMFAALLLGGLFLNYFYLTIKTKKLID
ncbi:TPA: ABC transporter permease [Streptococcus suis]|nr:ABC transporter permease [Streptococcus suis]